MKIIIALSLTLLKLRISYYNFPFIGAQTSERKETPNVWDYASETQSDLTFSFCPTSLIVFIQLYFPSLAALPQLFFFERSPRSLEDDLSNFLKLGSRKFFLQKAKMTVKIEIQ